MARQWLKGFSLLGFGPLLLFGTGGKGRKIKPADTHLQSTLNWSKNAVTSIRVDRDVKRLINQEIGREGFNGRRIQQPFAVEPFAKAFHRGELSADGYSLHSGVVQSGNKAAFSLRMICRTSLSCRRPGLTAFGTPIY